MGKYLGDLLFGGFVIILVVTFLRYDQQALNLLHGGADAYSSTVTQLSHL